MVRTLRSAGVSRGTEQGRPVPGLPLGPVRVGRFRVLLSPPQISWSSPSGSLGGSISTRVLHGTCIPQRPPCRGTSRRQGQPHSPRRAIRTTADTELA